MFKMKLFEKYIPVVIKFSSILFYACIIQIFPSFLKYLLQYFFPTGLRHNCFSDQQCESGMICLMDNSANATMKGGSKNMAPSPSSGSMNAKVCLCDEDDGYYENKNDHICSGEFKFISLKLEFQFILIFFFFRCINLNWKLFNIRHCSNNVFFI
jgi:hypothetical protein